MKKQYIIFLALLLALLLFPRVISAIGLQISIGGKTSVNDLSDYIKTLYLFFVPACGVLAAVMIFFGGYRWITAAGNANRIGEAKDTIIGAVFGLVLALTSYVLLNTINPNITALKSLYIPIVQQLTAPGGATRLCDFDGELSPISTPVLCGVVRQSAAGNSNSSGESCLGIASQDNNNYCLITKTNLGGESIYQGTEMNDVLLMNHPSGQTSFKAIHELECGNIRWVTGGSFLYPNQYNVGTGCPDAGGTERRCRLSEYEEQFLYIPGTPCDNEHQSGCGQIIGMGCSP